MSSEESLCIRNIKTILVRRMTNKNLQSTCIAWKYAISTNHVVASNYVINITKKKISCRDCILSVFNTL